jgi:hypothetical protein
MHKGYRLEREFVNEGVKPDIEVKQQLRIT